MSAVTFYRGSSRVSALPQFLFARAAWIFLWPASILVAVAYNNAARSESVTSQAHFNLFWIGILLFEIPVCVRLLQKEVGAGERAALVATLGLFATLPKVLRSPLDPIFHDEFAHWRQVDSIRTTGRLFAPNPTIDIIKEFPGLHGLTAILEDLTGTHSFALALVLVAALHVASLLGVFVLGSTVFDSSRAGGIAAFIYAANPSYMYFDAQFAYETYAVVIFIWVLACAARMTHSERRREQSSWLALGVLLGVACIITHHLTSYILVQCLACALVVAVIRQRRQRERRAVVVTLAELAGFIAIVAASWLYFVAPNAVGYLSHSLGGGLSEVADIVLRREQPRTLFQHSTTPHYERLAAFASPVLAFVAVLGAAILARRRRWTSSVGIGVAAYGLLYFPAVPLLLTSAGAEGASRTWAFTYVGLALIVATTLAAFVDGGRSGIRRAMRWVVVTGSLAVVIVGNVATLTSEDYRFPGPFIFGSDARSVTPEGVTMVKWFRKTYGVNRLVVSDRYTGLMLTSYGHEWTASPSLGFPVWQLYFNPHGASKLLLQELRSTGWQFLIVDKRIFSSLPRVGVYFEPDEPVAYDRSTPPPKVAYQRFFDRPWLIPVYQSENYTVFRFDFSALPLTTRPN